MIQSSHSKMEDIVMRLSCNVSINQVDKVIKAVLKKLFNMDVDRLPSSGSKYRLMKVALILAQMQVAESMVKGDPQNQGNCLHGYGKSKYHKHYQRFQLTTSTGKTLSFGLSEMAGGDAACDLSYMINRSV